MLDADPGRGRVVHAHQHRERLDPIGAVFVQRTVALVAGLRAAHAGAEEDADAAAVGLRQVDLRFDKSLASREARELADAIEHAQARRLEMLRAIELR